MQSRKKVLDFCINFTFYDLFNVDRVKVLNHIRDYIIIVSTEILIKHEDIRITLMSIIVDFSLKVTYKNVKNLQHEITDLRVDFLQVLCLKRLNKQEKDNGKWPKL